MSPDDSGFCATIVAVVGLHVVLAGIVFIVWKEGMPDWREEKNEQRSPCFQAAGVGGREALKGVFLSVLKKKCGFFVFVFVFFFCLSGEGN